MAEKDREWWKTQFRRENQDVGGSETVGDPSLHLPPMDLHLVEEPFGGCEQVSTIRKDRKHSAIGESVASVGGDALARIGKVSNQGKGSLG